MSDSTSVVVIVGGGGGTRGVGELGTASGAAGRPAARDGAVAVLRQASHGVVTSASRVPGSRDSVSRVAAVRRGGVAAVPAASYLLNWSSDRLGDAGGASGCGGFTVTPVVVAVVIPRTGDNGGSCSGGESSCVKLERHQKLTAMVVSGPLSTCTSVALLQAFIAEIIGDDSPVTALSLHVHRHALYGVS